MKTNDKKNTELENKNSISNNNEISLSLSSDERNKNDKRYEEPFEDEGASDDDFID